ncbi:MAG: 4Fe-4S binding protein [Helicobacteraceae bacterium]|jgi:energy-converting hydrogenase A subunit P|nr:4Fe-4S binding protein [Helicobacteraceae bacterium]
MAAIALNISSCVRSLAKFSECNKCEVICPTNAIVIDSVLPSINFSQCVACGGCAGVCPTEALKLDDFSATEFFFDFVESEESLISCRKNVPCISVLSVEHIIGLASLKKGVVFDMGHCDGCDIAHTCRAQIEANAEEANYVLEAMESSASVKLEHIAYMPEETIELPQGERRDFFRALTLKNAAKAKHKFDREVEIATDELVQHTITNDKIALIKQKGIPDKRKLLFTALKRAEKPSTYHIIDATELSFTSQKLFDEEKCTACQMCYRVCPTGSLTSNARNGKIDFDPFLCIKCHICHDVCEPDALTLSDTYNVKEFFEPSVQNLVTFDVQSCDECGRSFTSLAGAKMCYQCKCEDEEARELWGITDDM